MVTLLGMMHSASATALTLRAHIFKVLFFLYHHHRLYSPMTGLIQSPSTILLFHFSKSSTFPILLLSGGNII